MDFRSANGVSDALTWLAELGSEAQVLAGGTDVMIQYARREITPSAFVHIERLDELRRINQGDGRLVLGGLATHRTLATDARILREFPAMAEAAETVGGWQTQLVGTVGGNVCNASPAADVAPPLLVADAEVTLRSAGGERTVTLDDFFLGRRSTARRPDELLIDFSLARPPSRTGETYLKVGRRRAMEVAIVGLAARLWFEEDGETVAGARLAMCSVAPRPIRAPAAEEVLVGSRLEPDAVGEAGRALTEAANPIDDVRSDAQYRRATIAPLLGRAVTICKERAASSGGAASPGGAAS